MRIYVGNLIIQKLYLVKLEKSLRWFNQIIAMIHLSIRILQCCNSYSFHLHIAMFFSIHSRMASEADLLKLNIVRFELMRLLCFIDAGK